MNNVSVSGFDNLGATHNGFPPCGKAVCMLLLSELRQSTAQTAIQNQLMGSDVLTFAFSGFAVQRLDCDMSRQKQNARIPL